MSIPAGCPDEADGDVLRLRARQMRRDGTWQQWLVRAVVLRAERRLVGHAGFHGPPGENGPGVPDAVELGYTICVEHRGQGYATEASEALMRWATEEHGIRRFIASVAPSNGPSLAVLGKLGFVQTGEQWDDEDGLELVFELRR